MMTSVMQPAFSRPAGIPRDSALPTYNTDVQPKTSPPSYDSAVNQQDQIIEDQRLGSTCALLTSHYPIQPNTNQPDILAPAAPVRNNRGRNVKLVSGISVFLFISTVIMRLIWSASQTQSTYPHIN